MKARRSSRVLIHAVLILVALTCLVPFFWMLSTSFKLREDIFVAPPQWLPSPFTTANYLNLVEYIPFVRQFLNTLLVTSVIVVGQLIFSSMGAYAFARLRFRGREQLFLLFLSSMLVPGAVTLIPTFILIRQFGWINSYMGLIAPYVLGSAFATFFLRQFMLNVSTDLEDAARIDGAGHYVIFTKIILPLVRPALAVLAIFGFVFFWNDFLWPLVVINSDQMKVLTVGVATLAQGPHGTDWGVLMAGAVVSTLPLVLAFLVAQRQFIEAISLTGSVKG